MVHRFAGGGEGHAAGEAELLEAEHRTLAQGGEDAQSVGGATADGLRAAGVFGEESKARTVSSPTAVR